MNEAFLHADEANVPPVQADREVVGIQPWLPWPLSAWDWWTEPVRAERLALFRIGVALALLVDLLLNYVPNTLGFYGKDGLGDPASFDWRFQTHRMNWSLLRGVGDPTILTFSLAIWIAATLWILGNSCAWLLLLHKNQPRPDRSGIALWIWCGAYVWYIAGLWSNLVAVKQINDQLVESVAWTAPATGFIFVFLIKPIDSFAWVVPLVGFSLVCLFYALDIAARLRGSPHRIPLLRLVVTLVVTITLTSAGFLLTQMETIDKTAWWGRLLGSWQDDATLLWTAMFLWLAATVLLLFGFWTRLAAVLTWLLSMSFANANPNLDNAGDTIRVILLFYLMLCPCGAVWSIDSLWTSTTRKQVRIFVHPWPIRLIFLQMIFIYFMNGVYKLMGPNWLDGQSLFWVLGDVVLTRFSPYMLQIPLWLGRVMTWTVLAWEVSFPVLALWKWSRRAALIMGVLFHLGIFATMELGGFVPYALCMYLPLIPWGKQSSVSQDMKPKPVPPGTDE
jgi:hypothetical protein